MSDPDLPDLLDLHRRILICHRETLGHSRVVYGLFVSVLLDSLSRALALYEEDECDGILEALSREFPRKIEMHRQDMARFHREREMTKGTIQ